MEREPEITKGCNRRAGAHTLKAIECVIWHVLRSARENLAEVQLALPPTDNVAQIEDAVPPAHAFQHSANGTLDDARLGVEKRQVRLTFDGLNDIDTIDAQETEMIADPFTYRAAREEAQVRFNLLPQTAEGLDLSLRWEKRRTAWGSFTAQINAAQLLEFTRAPGPIIDSLYAARDAGTINALTTLPDSSDLIAQNGRPEWKITTSFTWRHGPWRTGLSTQYVSDIYQSALLSDAGVPWTVQEQLITNVYVQYDFDDLGWAGDTSLRVGVRDLTDEGPSLADGGYRGTVNQPYGRYFWARLTQRF